MTTMTSRQLAALDRKQRALIVAANDVLEEMRLNGASDERIARHQALNNEWAIVNAKWRAGNPGPRKVWVD